MSYRKFAHTQNGSHPVEPRSMAARKIGYDCRKWNFGGGKTMLRFHARKHFQLESASN